MSSPIVILAGARTPIGKLSGSLASFSATELGGFAIAAALERAGLSGDRVDYTYMGHVLQAGAGQITARQAAVNGGIPMDIPATTVNKVCLSGIDAIYQADRRIRCGDAEIVVAGGMESMTNAPHLLPGARAGYRIGDGTLVDSMMYDGLYCAFDQVAMGARTEKYAQAHGLEREHMDAMAAESHRRADAAQQSGRYDNEIVPVTSRSPVCAPCSTRPATSPPATPARSATAPRPPSSRPPRSPTDSASPRSPRSSGTGRSPGPTRPCCTSRPGRSRRRSTGPGWPCAIAHGPPLGMSGNRIALHLALELARRDGGTGAAALCGGGGQGDAIIVRTMK